MFVTVNIELDGENGSIEVVFREPLIELNDVEGVDILVVDVDVDVDAVVVVVIQVEEEVITLNVTQYCED